MKRTIAKVIFLILGVSALQCTPSDTIPPIGYSNCLACTLTYELPFECCPANFCKVNMQVMSPDMTSYNWDSGEMYWEGCKHNMDIPCDQYLRMYITWYVPNDPACGGGTGVYDISFNATATERCGANVIVPCPTRTACQ